MEKDNKTHLCDSCQSNYPECGPGNIIFGNGKGNDNIIACSLYIAASKPKSHPIKNPATIGAVIFGKTEVIRKPFFGGETGDLVRVRPCGEKYENKTYLGILIGDVAQSPTVGILQDNEEVKTLKVDLGQHNPAILIPDLKEIVFGCASWWGKITKEEHLKSITDADIENVWYVKALKQIAEKDAEKKEEKPA
jgi:hypothetical protein